MKSVITKSQMKEIVKSSFRETLLECYEKMKDEETLQKNSFPIYHKGFFSLNSKEKKAIFDIRSKNLNNFRDDIFRLIKKYS